jgi:hypothetical protein
MGWLSQLFDPDPVAVPVNPPAVVPAPRHEDDLLELLAEVAEVERRINHSARDLPTAGIVLARQITDEAGTALRHDIERGGHLDIRARMSFNDILRKFLPSTLRSFIRAQRSGGTTSQGQTPEEALIEQLTRLRDAVAQLRRASDDEDVRALGIQGRFLEDTFGRTDLDDA